MMGPTKIVVQNKRFKYHTLTAKSWKVLTTYVGKEVPLVHEIPSWLVDHWKSDKSVLGYARFSGLTPSQAIIVIGLAKADLAVLCTDRWSRVSGYKLRIARLWS